MSEPQPASTLHERKKLARFAQDLFGEPFPASERTVIVGKRNLHPTLRAACDPWTFTAVEWIKLGGVISRFRATEAAESGRAGKIWNEYVAEAELVPLAAPDGENLGDHLAEVLASNRQVRTAAQFLEDRGAVAFEQLARTLFPRDDVNDQHGACAALISAGFLGRFLMGSPETEPGRHESEGPQHEVTISNGFWLFDTPCTQALWQAVMGDNPSAFRSSDRPVENVSLEDVHKVHARVVRPDGIGYWLRRAHHFLRKCSPFF